jgi:hypothetical protein
MKKRLREKKIINESTSEMKWNGKTQRRKGNEEGSESDLHLKNIGLRFHS